MPLRTPRIVTVALLAGAAVVSFGHVADAADECGLPEQRPLWIEYGEGAVPPEVRSVFQRPGVVVAASGTGLPNTYRSRGASTVYFVLSLPRVVGEPSVPADPATIDGAAYALFDRATESTSCGKPLIGLNELLGPAAATPWSPLTATYRSNVLALVKRLAALGARPALFVHGNPNVSGEAGAWWRDVASAADLVYEAYYNARNIDRLGRILGPRRIRLGMRSVIRLFMGVGVPRERIGFALGFQVAPGAAGREGLQPRESWLRVVKWHALAARQVATDEGSPSIWSWGWGTFGPQSVDPDKPAAACVYLWSRDSRLCDGPATAGPEFDASLVEGPIAVTAGVLCMSVAGRLRSAAVDELSRLTRDRRVALNALFARSALRMRVPVSGSDILRAERTLVERAFGGSRDAYLLALERRGATVAVARGVIADELRRSRVAAFLGSNGNGVTTLTWAADVEVAAVATATCLRDDLPGTTDFPRSDQREVGVVPLAFYLPFLMDDDAAPATPSGLIVTPSPGGATLDWQDGAEADLAGYHVYRSDAAGTTTRLTSAPQPRSSFADASASIGAGVAYSVRAVDTSGNESEP